MWPTFFFPSRTLCLLRLLTLLTLFNSVASLRARQSPDNMVLTQLPPELDEVDVILVGGGTAASVVASRLSDADSQLSVLVIERGPDNYNVPSVIHPALYRANFDPSHGTMLYYVSEQEEQVANRSISIGTGGTLGGGSSINVAIYARGESVDYDSWATEGWYTNDLIPFLKKIETYHPSAGEETHGYDGPTDVSSGRFSSDTVRDDFISAAKQLGYPAVDDVHDLHTGNAVSPGYRYVSPTTGRRQDAAHTYLHPRLGSGSGSGDDTSTGGNNTNTNLHVLVQSQVSRVLFDDQEDDKRASGVEFRDSDGTMHTVKARKLVIVSAGALGTPQILERSGVGDPQVLKQAGVPVVQALDGVGHQYQDHQMFAVVYNSTLTANETVDSVVNGAMNITELLERDAGILSWNGIDTYAKLRPTEAEVDAFEPGLRTAWHRDFAHTPEKPLAIILPMSSILGNPFLFPTTDQYMSMCCYSTYPYSRGHVHITGAGMDDPLDFKSGYLSDAEGVDLQILVWLYKKQRQFTRRMTIRREEVSPRPQYNDSSAAATTDNDASLQQEDVTYSSADNAAIAQWARENVRTAYHPMGTCPMAPREKKGVLDARLGVHGTRGLKVADLSIPPENVSGNPMSLALVVGEKAADIIIRELGLGKS